MIKSGTAPNSDLSVLPSSAALPTTLERPRLRTDKYPRQLFCLTPDLSVTLTGLNMPSIPPRPGPPPTRPLPPLPKPK